MEREIPPGLRFAILSRAFKKRLDVWTGEMGLTSVQMRVLGELSRMENAGVGEVNQRDLEQAEQVTHPTMTEIIKRLEKKGFVRCVTSDTDRRYKKITCTEKSIHLHEELEKRDAAIFREFCRGLSPEQAAILDTCLDVMLENAARNQENHK